MIEIQQLAGFVGWFTTSTGRIVAWMAAAFEAGSRRGRSVGAIGATGWRRASQQAGVADQ
jgi:hypothetical protein